ncbi:RidA family protein [Chitinophaga pendula]|uniref:RidA family protein n=1 Tax=Chitinophaga TaxID=79328 RepID=UPI000BAF0A91|nr:MULTISPECIES: RidA family protein [Chitinophaga]ASZ12683.1 reactive intermediate/imine deaminase [Chitinophaga sp. MD30]UCJ09706.1 RidA family protein [Chitinophaga pendula]
MKMIAPANLPTPAGHYTPGVVSGNLLFVSGQLPVKPDGSHTSAEPFEVQAQQAISNLLEVVKAAGAAVNHIVKVNVYIAGVQYWPVFNQLYAAAMGNHKPARAIIPVPELHHGYLVEIDAVAELPQ